MTDVSSRYISASLNQLKFYDNMRIILDYIFYILQLASPREV